MGEVGDHQNQRPTDMDLGHVQTLGVWLWSQLADAMRIGFNDFQSDGCQFLAEACTLLQLR
jgi:hypothetical protein